MRSRSRCIQALSSVSAEWRGAASTHPENSRRIGLSSASLPRTNGPSNIPPATPNNCHQMSRIASSPSGRNGSTRNPARRRASAALRMLVRVSSVTGVRPSSSKYPIAVFLSCFSVGQRSATGAAAGSPSSGPCMTSNSRRRSPIVRAIGPTTPNIENGPADCGKCPVEGIRPGVGFKPQIPQKCEGTRIDPPPSLPTPPAESPAAIAAASPPLEPPAVHVKSNGLLVLPYKRLSVSHAISSSGVFVTPMTIAPAFRNRWTSGASFRPTTPRRKALPDSHGIPFTSIALLILIGTPCRGPSS